MGVELAGILHGLGALTTQLYRGDLFLRGSDDDFRKTLADEMRTRGVYLLFMTDFPSI
jgi:glutathione reductase (NADPH)